MTQNNSRNVAVSPPKEISVPKTEPITEPHREDDPTSAIKHPSFTPSISRILPNTVAQLDDDIEEIPIVKSEPSEPNPSVTEMTTTSNLPESMAMYEDVSHMMTMDSEEYDDYGGHYDNSALPGQDSTVTDNRILTSDFREGE